MRDFRGMVRNSGPYMVILGAGWLDGGREAAGERFGGARLRRAGFRSSAEVGASTRTSQERCHSERTEDHRSPEIGLDLDAPQADPNFDAKVAHPAYSGTKRRVRVLFDEGHHSVLTANGLYKPLADLITSDGYEVFASRAQFSPQVLAKGDVLIIVNARRAELMGETGSAGAAFTESECNAVRDWINAGGSLLLIAGTGPPAAAAERLAMSLGKGRVVVLAEAAHLSAQMIRGQELGMNVPGIDNRQLALNIMHWLSGLLEPRDGMAK